MKINLLAIWKKDDDFYHYHGTIVRVCVCVFGGGVSVYVGECLLILVVYWFHLFPW